MDPKGGVETSAGDAAPSPARLTLPTHSPWGDRVFRYLTAAVALALLGLFLYLVYLLVENSLPTLDSFGSSFFTGTQWNTAYDEYGALPFVVDTLITSAIALAIAIPVSLGIAVFLSEQAPASLRLPLGALVDLLAAIPSVIYGIWGFWVLGPYMRTTVEPWLQRTFPGNPAFSGTPTGTDILTAGLVLSIMVIPTISALSREAMKAVPQPQREAALGLGATRWETIRLGVVRNARTGIFGATILGLGRAVGETMAVTIVIGGTGSQAYLPTSLFSQGNTMASIVALDFEEASINPAAIFEVALFLLAVTLAINIAARLLMWRLSRFEGAAA